MKHDREERVDKRESDGDVEEIEDEASERSEKERADEMRASEVRTG